MKPKNGKDRIYARVQGSTGAARYYADVRDLGHGQVALKSPGSGRATDDPDEARILLGELLKAIREGKMPTKTAKPTKQLGDETRLGPMSERFIKDNPRGNVPKSVETKKRHLGRAKKFFGADRPLKSIESRHVRKWMDKLAGEGKSNQTILHHIWALSPVFEYARELGTWTSAEAKNPVQRIYGKPKARRGRHESQKAKYLEIPDAAKILKAAKKLDRINRNGLIQFVYPLIATFLLTGGRQSEVLGLTWDDIDVDLDFITFRPNKWRGLKREWSERTIPLWSQLKPILKDHRKKMNGSDLVFPSPRLEHVGTEGMIHDIRKIMRNLKKTSGVDFPGGGVTIFRHTYATARLQTTDNGKQISLWTVAKELGHKNVSRIEDTYGHPSHFRPRGEVVEYRVGATHDFPESAPLSLVV